MVTRRDMISLAVAGLAGTALESSGAITRSSLALRGAMMGGGKKKWHNPYVTDGLVAMWDGEWNAGCGVHDSSAEKWTNLVGVVALEQSYGGEKPIWTSTSLNLDGVMRTLSCPNPMLELSKCTMEVCLNPSNKDGWYVTLRGSGSGSYLQIITYNGSSQINFNSAYFSDIVFAGKSTLSYSFEVSNAEGKTEQSSFVNGNLFGNRKFEVSNRLLISGASQEILSVGSAKPFNNLPATGDIMCIRIYNRALTAEEIAANYAVDAARFNI